jgi:hypothetical protein
MLRVHLSPGRLAIVKETNNECRSRMQGKRNPYTPLVGIELSTITMELSIEVPQKTQSRLTLMTYDTTLGHIAKRV